MSEVQQFARIRASQCWERRGKTIHIKDKAIGIAPDYNSTITRPIVNFIEFEDVFEEHSTNQDIFDKVLKPMCDHAVSEKNASNSIFICHGQSATGKTHTIMGSDGSEEGVLQLSAQYLLEHSVSHNVELQVIESYGKSKKKIRVFDGLRGQEIQSDALNEKGISSFFMWSEKNSGIQRTVKTIRSNLHFGCTARHNQSSKGHVAYVLSIRKEDDVQTRVILLDLGAAKNKSRKAQFQGLQKQIRAFATGGQLKKHTSDPIQTLLYPFLVDESKPLLMNILFTFSPSITCAEESRLTLRDVHSITGCRVYPERCCWKKEHLEDPSLRFKNAAKNTILKVKALKQFAHRNPQNLKGQNKELKVIIENVRQSMAEQQPNELVLDSIAMGTSSQDDELQQERLMNITTFQGRRRTVEQKAVSLYYEELQFAIEATKHILGDELLSKEERKIMDQTRQIIQMEMESIQSAARNSISSSFAMDEASPEAQRRVSDAMGIQGVESESSDPENDQKRTSSPSASTNTTESSPELAESEILRDSKGVNDEYLKAERGRLEQYEKTLKETLNVLKAVSSYEECFPEEVKRIEDELERLNQELIALGDQTNAFHNHTNDIQMAMEQQVLGVKDDENRERMRVVIQTEDLYDDESSDDFYLEDTGSISSEVLLDTWSRRASTSAVFWKYFCWFCCRCRYCCQREDVIMREKQSRLLQRL